MTTEGRHLICEMHGARSELLNDRMFIEILLREAALRSGATVVGGQFHQFSPQGVTGILLLSESHLSIHTWPERGYAAVDLYTCGEKTQTRKAMEYMRRELHALRADIKEIRRGMHEAIEVPEEDWFYEDAESQEIHGFAKSESLCQMRSKFQEIAIVKNDFYGKILFLDGASQSAQHDEYIYHEALVHPAMFNHPSPRNVLILGGGEGATLREVLRHRDVQRAVMVDIDGELVEQCRQHLPEWSKGAFEDPRTQLIIEDGYQWIKNNKDLFDVIIMDLTDQVDIGPSFPLYTKKFFKSLSEHLTADGILVVQAGVLMEGDTFSHACIKKTIQDSFGNAQSYAQYISSFFSEWSFVISAKNGAVRDATFSGLDAQIRNRLTSPLRFYSEETHHRMFTLLPGVARELVQRGVVIESKEQFARHYNQWNAAQVCSNTIVEGVAA